MSANSSFISSTLRTAVDSALDAAFSANFVQDPVLIPELSRLVSVTNSVVKRHGPLIEAAIASALTETGRFEVIRNLRFPIVKTADDLVAANAPEDLAHFQLKFDSEPHRSVDLDLFAIDTVNDVLFAADVKRGNGVTEGRKRGPIEASLDAVRLLGRSYTRQRGYPVEQVRVAIIDYHGLSQFSDRLRIGRDGLDAFFGAPIVATVEAMTDYVHAAVRRRTPELIGQLAEALGQEKAELTNVPLDRMAAAFADDMPVSPVRLPLGMPRTGRRPRVPLSATY